MKLRSISSIIVEKKDTWEDRAFITIDIDWAVDEILLDTINLITRSDVHCTWFVTHATPVIEVLRDNPKFELGIHPNFNNLLNQDYSNGRSPEECIDNLLKIVPEAKAVRSHSMLQSSKILELFKSRGLSHDCNHFIPERTGIELCPWVHWNGIVRVPHFWEDDINIVYDQQYDAAALLKSKGLKVYDFHPIHIFLNTESENRYSKTRPMHYDPQNLIKHRGDSNDGARKQIIRLMDCSE